MSKAKPRLSFTPNKEKGEILYTHVQTDNKKFVTAEAEKKGISASEYVDQLLTQVRTKKLI